MIQAIQTSGAPQSRQAWDVIKHLISSYSLEWCTYFRRDSYSILNKEFWVQIVIHEWYRSA